VAALAAVGGLPQRGVTPATPAVPITSIDPDRTRHHPTGVSELDRVLGGGVVPGSVTVLAGDPGVGKSTLLLEVAHRWAQGGRRALYVSGEESAGQIRMRAERTGCAHDEVYLAAESDVQTVLGHLDAVNPSLVIVDSVQTMTAGDTDGVVGGVTQVRAVTTALTATAKASGVAVVLVGHVTKDGAIAGPRSLEHLVDVVLHFEGDRNTALRMVRGVKNRFGAADEVGCFLMQDKGIECVADPSGLFLDQRDKPVPGTAVTVTLDGKRPLIGEIQALLTAPNHDRAPRRIVVSGMDQARVSMITAVLDKRARVAMSSAVIGRPLPSTLVVFGEVGLAGDLRRVTGMDRRLAEAARLGFTTAVVPVGCGTPPTGLRTLESATINDALRAVLSITGGPEPDR
jgi:DNA repair protein RadA/Sms